MGLLDRTLTIRGRGVDLAPPVGGSWRTFGSPIGAGQPVGGILADSPPWPADAADDSGFRELPESPAVSLFVANNTLLESWLDTQDGSPSYWELAARQLSQGVADGTGIADAMVGRTLAVRGLVFGVVVAAQFVPRQSTNRDLHRHATDRIDLTLDRDAPRLTYYDFIGVPSVDRSMQDEASYVWGFLDPVALFTVSTFDAWCEVIDTLSVDSLAVNIEEVEQVSDQRIEATIRVRYDDRITPFSSLTLAGDTYSVSSVQEEIGAGRRRFMVLRARRYALSGG